MKRVYLDNACSGLFTNEVLQVPKEFVALMENDEVTAGDKNLIMRGYLKRARERVGSLINCHPDEVALVESTSHAMGIVSDFFDLTQKDNVLVCDLEYQASYLCLRPKQKKIGFEIRPVAHEGGEITAEIFEKYADEDTKLIIIATVQEINGFRADLESICRMAHRRGIKVLADGIQEVGAMRVDVKQTDVDFYCAGGKKWIGNPFGMGFLYIRKDLIGKYSPAYDSYFNVMLPQGYDDYMSYLENPNRTPFDDCPTVTTAMKFEVGAFKNYIGALGLARAIEVLQAKGIENIEEHIFMLNRRLSRGLAELGIKTSSSQKPRNMSSSVCFNFGLKDNSSVQEKKLERYLFEHNIFVSLRCSSLTGGIRVSMHYYTTPRDIDEFLAFVREYLGKQADG